MNTYSSEQYTVHSVVKDSDPDSYVGVRGLHRGDVFKVIKYGEEPSRYDGTLGICICDGTHWAPIGERVGLGYTGLPSSDGVFKILKPGDAFSLIVRPHD